MAGKETLVEKIMRVMKDRTKIRNISTAAHIDHGKTTVSDSLLAGAGMLSEEIAGQARALDYLEEEQQRGITIQAAAVSMVHEYEGETYLINLIDTPGHIDFSGEVTRAMRAVDGVIIIVDAVEGVMPQTETVIRQSLREYVKPILFINKVDRLITELKLDAKQMQERFARIIKEVNRLIEEYSPEEFKDKWKVSVEDGSGIHKWAISFPYIKKTGVTFKDIIEAYEKGKEAVRELAKKIPLHKVLLDMVVKHLPSPVEAQKYRVKHIWSGDLESEVGKALVNCDPNGPLVIEITKIIVDPQAGELGLGRVFSGTAKRGMEVFLRYAQRSVKLQQIYVSKGPHRLQVEEVPAGNIIGIAGIKGLSVGEIITSSPDIPPFREIKHLFEPVVTKAVEVKNPRDLGKLIQILRAIGKEYYPDVRVEINERTGEYLISGQGELHLEWIETKIRKYFGLDIVTSPPIVVYRETVTKRGEVAEGKSPNKHNKIYIQVEPLEDEVYEAIRRGLIPEGKVKKGQLWKILEKYGMDREEAKRVLDVYGGNVFVDMTVGIIHLREAIDMILTAFEQMCKEGPLAKEPMAKVKVKLVDAILHEDAIHRGPAQIIPATRQAIRKAFFSAMPTLLEPIQRIRIDGNAEYFSNVAKLIQSKRGKLREVEHKGDKVTIIADMPVAELIGFTSELRSASQGRMAWFRVDQYFAPVPKEMVKDIIKKIRERKGLPPEIRGLEETEE